MRLHETTLSDEARRSALKWNKRNKPKQTETKHNNRNMERKQNETQYKFSRTNKTIDHEEKQIETNLIIIIILHSLEIFGFSFAILYRSYASVINLITWTGLKEIVPAVSRHEIAFELQPIDLVCATPIYLTSFVVVTWPCSSRPIAALWQLPLVTR